MRRQTTVHIAPCTLLGRSLNVLRVAREKRFCTGIDKQMLFELIEQRDAPEHGCVLLQFIQYTIISTYYFFDWNWFYA